MASSNNLPDSHTPDDNLSRRIFNLANRDFCPWANQYVYWLKQPIGWMIVAAAATALIGIFLAPQGWVMFAALAAVILLGVIWPWIAIRGVHCSLSFNRRRASENERVQVTLTIRNSFPWPIWGLAVEGGFFSEELSIDGDSTAVALASVPGWTTTDFEWDFEPHRRGLYPSGVSQLASGFPFGIWYARDDIQTNSELIVWPRTVKLASVPAVKGNELTSTGVLINQAGQEGDVLAVRPYRRGDALKHVHWAQTARHSRLIVCERQTAAHRLVEVIIDTDPRNHQFNNADSSFEWNIRVGASLIRQFHEHGWSVTYRTDSNSLRTTANTLSLKSTFDNLAMLQPVECNNFGQYHSEPNTRNKMRIAVTTSVRMAKLQQLNEIDHGTKFVVLQTNDSAIGTNSWLTINCNQDIPLQLQKQWERLCHDTWSAT